jgi:hypothetical protein
MRVLTQSGGKGEVAEEGKSAKLMKLDLRELLKPS